MFVEAMSKLVGLNAVRIRRILETRNDPDYKAIPDVRYTDINPNAEVVKGVNIGEHGEILSQAVEAGKKILVRVDLSYAPGDSDPLEVFPCDDEWEPGKRKPKEQCEIATLGDEAYRKYPALLMAIDNFNRQEQTPLRKTGS